MRPTKERLDEIRKHSESFYPNTHATQELVAEIDALRAENEKLQTFYDTHVATVLLQGETDWYAIAKAAEKERDQLRADYRMLREKFEEMSLELRDKLDVAVKQLEEFADYENPNELKYMAWPSNNYMGKAREALAKIKGEN